MNTNEKTAVKEITKENAELFLSDEKYFKNGHLDLSGLTCLERIGEEAFKGKNIESVVFPECLREIGHKAFANNQLKIVDMSILPFVNTYFNAFDDNPLEDVKVSKQWEGRFEDPDFMKKMYMSKDFRDTIYVGPIYEDEEEGIDDEREFVYRELFYLYEYNEDED